RLRWRPTSASGWASNRATGYRLERRELTATATESDWTSLSPGPIREAGLEEWVTLIESDSLTGITGAMLYEDSRPIDYLTTDGSPESILAQGENLNNAYLYLLMGCDLRFTAAVAAGLALRDTDVQAGKYYQYRLRPASEDGTWVTQTIRAGAATPLPDLQQLNVTFTDQEAALSWTPPPFRYPSFDVLRSTNATGPWRTVNPQRLNAGTVRNQNLRFTDSLPDNEQTYFYAIQPHTAWGVQPEPSQPVSGRGIPRQQLPMPFVTTKEEHGRAVVNWSLEPGGDSTLIEAFYVYRSYENGGGRQYLAGPLGTDTRTYRDSILRNNQFYTVECVDARGRAVASVPGHFLSEDSIAPPPPMNLVGEVDLEGNVSLAWDHSQADDVIGYRVFYSNAAERPGTRVTDTLETTNLFRDSLDLRSLGDTVYYRVVALDERENVGDFSDPYALVLPDILPPAPPRLREFRADTNGVLFTWAPSSSDDVVNYRLERRAR
ncbi:MAG: fibronectin type III domain-containing protein, partial [Bacteroidota bacterium]